MHKSHQKRITIKDIAAMANVSIGTVDRVLHNRGEVNRLTRDRVLSFVEELGYTPNLIAKTLALKKNYRIAALIPDAGKNNPYWDKPLEGLHRARVGLKDFNTEVAVFNFDPGNETSFKNKSGLILNEAYDGIIFVPHFYDAALDFIQKCEERKTPFVLMDTDLDTGSKLAYFGQDARQSGYVAARLMHYGIADCSVVLVLNLARNKLITKHMQRRSEGFMHYFRNTFPESCIKTLPVEIDLILPGEPEKSLRRVLSAQPDIAGIFVTNSRAHLVAASLESQKISNVLLIGYDMIEANCEFLAKGIIDFLICQKPEEQGYNSVMTLFNYLLTGRSPEKVNYSPIDIIVKENIGYHRNFNPSGA
jgi:LacI family transcriptional regulator